MYTINGPEWGPKSRNSRPWAKCGSSGRWGGSREPTPQQLRVLGSAVSSQTGPSPRGVRPQTNFWTSKSPGNAYRQYKFRYSFTAQICAANQSWERDWSPPTAPWLRHCSRSMSKWNKLQVKILNYWHSCSGVTSAGVIYSMLQLLRPIYHLCSVLMSICN